MSLKAIDVHCHIIPKAYVEGMADAGVDPAKEDGFPTPSWSLPEQLSYMEENNLEKCILSLSTPHLHFGDNIKARKLARQINEETAKVCAEHPEKFDFAACLPMPDVQGTLQEIAYVYDVLKAKGVKMASNSRGVYLGDSRFEPIFEELNARHAVVTIHPSKPPAVPGNVFTAGPSPLFEYIADTTRAVLNLMTSGTISRYPNVKIIVPHCGAFLPIVAHRLMGISQVLIPKGLMAPVNVMEDISTLYFDMAGDALPVGLDALRKIASPAQLLYGGDFPYTPVQMIIQKKQALLESPLLKDSLAAVFHDNAARLYGLS